MSIEEFISHKSRFRLSSSPPHSPPLTTEAFEAGGEKFSVSGPLYEEPWLPRSLLDPSEVSPSSLYSSSVSPSSMPPVTCLRNM